jgi:hypothetical protein
MCVGEKSHFIRIISNFLAERHCATPPYIRWCGTFDQHLSGFLKGWIAVAENSTIKPMVKAAKTLRNRGKGILRWFTSHLTNAVMEGLNSLLQAAKRKARGHRLHKTFITMAYLIAGKLDLGIHRCSSGAH